MTGEEVLDLFFDCMDVTHWSTSVADVDLARERTLRVIGRREWIAVTPAEQAEIALGLKLLATRQRRLRYGNPATTDALRDRFRLAPETPKIAEAPPQEEDQ